MAGPVTELSVRDFGARLASNEPTPGGGSAAALAGSLGAGLVCMVCNFTVGREKYAGVEEEMQGVLRRSEELRVELEQAAEDDVKAYGGYADAQKLPRESEEEQAARQRALDDAMRASTLVPLGVAERCGELLALALRAAELGNRFLISDAAVGAELAAAGKASAELNVRLNLAWVDDEAFAADVRGRLSAVAAQGRELAERTTAVVEERADG